MTTWQIASTAVAAVLTFWAVGAHNRLVQLRNTLVRRYAPVQQQLALRHELLGRQLQALAPMLLSAGPRLDALRAASAQAASAGDHARLHPGAAGAITSLKLAEDILADARARLPMPTVGGGELPELASRVAGADSALGFARVQFNAAVTAYNQALRQFPTRLIGAAVGFRPAATL